MRYVKLVATGLEVSKICLGCMSFGTSGAGTHGWTLDEDSGRPFIRRAVDAGVNFFDTANAYSLGSSEEILGCALADFADRDEVVIATKVYGPMRRGRNALGLSRKAIMTEVDASLRRLGVDYIDLYQIHRWDAHTPIEETMQALHDVVKAGKMRYLGASSMFAWQFGKALHTSELSGLTSFVSMQNHYNLLNREEEREMMPLCVDRSVAVIPWSPLARGKLTRDWDATTTRSESDEFGKTLYDTSASDRDIVAAVANVAADRGAPRAQVAMAWLFSQTMGDLADRRRHQAGAHRRRRRSRRAPDVDRGVGTELLPKWLAQRGLGSRR